MSKSSRLGKNLLVAVLEFSISKTSELSLSLSVKLSLSFNRGRVDSRSGF
jgi:hypothetical protein